MSRKKRTPRLIMIYDVSGGRIKEIPIREPGYSERRKKRRIAKESEESVLPSNESDQNDHVIDLLSDFQDNSDEMDDFYSISDFDEYFNLFDKKQPTDSFLIEEAFLTYMNY